MSLLKITLCAAFMVTLVLSKPVSQSETDSSNESSETNSSEEGLNHVAQPREPIQAASEEVEETEETEPPGTEAPLPSVDASPSVATLSTTALPDLMDPQTSTDNTALYTMHPMAGDTLQTTVSTDIQNSTDIQPLSEVSLNTEVADANLTNQLQVTTTTYQELTPDVTTPVSPHTIQPSPQPSSTTPPISVPIRASMTAVPVCFTLQFSSSEPELPRGDSM